jgi:hypothetical protein
MTRLLIRRCVVAAGVAVVVGVCLMPAWSSAREDLPAKLSDREFWKLAAESSETDGYFRSDTLTSNELLYQRVIPELVARTKPGSVYLGVGPEQNFTYMAALRPAMAIIFDIRRGNMLVQLMYKALFELSTDRADFVGRLFSRPRPPGLRASSTVTELFSAFGAVQADEALYTRNLQAVKERLVRVHGLPLTAKDLEGIEYAYHAFFSRGYAIRYSPTYSELMVQTDDSGVRRSYLSSEANFAFLKALQSNNLVVPVVGDFAGPKAIRSIGAYLKAHDAKVTAFYLSNVEQYLTQDGKWEAFCRNFSTLPLDASSTFIRSTSRRGPGFGGGFVNSLGSITAEARECE